MIDIFSDVLPDFFDYQVIHREFLIPLMGQQLQYLSLIEELQ